MSKRAAIVSPVDEAQARVIAEWRERCATMPGRSVPEWKGKTKNTKPSPTVRARVFETWGGICHLSKMAIAGKPWHLEHVIPLDEDGQNREGNLRPALTEPHSVKTRAEKARKTKADRVAMIHKGVKQPSGKLASRGFTPTRPQKKASARLRKKPVGVNNISRRFST